MSQSLLPFSSPVSYAPSDYVVTDVNRAVFDTLMQPDKWGSHGCLLIGEEGSGKTHLAHIWQERFGAGYIGAGYFDDLGEDALPGDPYLIVEAIDDPNVDSEIFFHLLNAVCESGRKLLLTSSAEPRSFARLPDLLSRLNALCVLHIPAPDEELLSALVRKFFADRQLRIDESVVRTIAQRADRSYAGLRTLVARLDESSLIKKQSVNSSLVRRALEGGE